MDKALIIGGSAGSFKIISRIIKVLPAVYPFPIFICIHRLRNVKTGIIPALDPYSRVTIREPFDKEIIEPGVIYLAPPNYHILFDRDGYFTLSATQPFNHSRPSIDIAMKSAASVYGKNLIGILISGANSDGSEGMMAIHDAGGMTIIQDPLDAEISPMPEAAISSFQPDYIFNADKIINFIGNLAAGK